MNNHCFRTKETALANGRTLKLSYHMDRGIWKMTGGRWGEHTLSERCYYMNDRVQAHWDGYCKAQYAK